MRNYWKWPPWRSYLLVLCLSFSAPAWGQTLSGTILGTVTDATGAVISNVEIKVTHSGTNQNRTVTTNSSGNYSIPSLPVGSYELEASRAGFRTARQTGITLQIGQEARLNIALEVGAVAQVIEVVAQTALLQTDESSIGTVIDSRKIVSLPISGRNFDALIQLLPGAVTHAPGSELSNRGGFNVVGIDENFNSFFLDGFDNVDPVLRNFSFQPSIDLIEEFKVEQSSYAAEFGRNAGAVINATTKSGTNAFHGTVWAFLRNKHLDARDFFASPDNEKPSLIRNQFGAALGGPVISDRTFFYAFYGGFREKRGDTRRATVPSLLMRDGNFSELSAPILDPQSGEPFPNNIIPADRMNPITRDVIQAYPLPNVTGALTGNRIEIANHIEDSDDVSIRLDHRLIGSTEMMARYSFSNARVLDPFWTDTPGSTNLKDFPQTFDRIRTNLGVGFTTPIGDNTVHEFRMGYNRFKQPQIPLRAMPANQAPIAGVNETFLDFRPAGFDAIGSNRRFSRVANVYNFINQASWFKGDHQLKFGLDLRRYDFSGFSAATNQFRFTGANLFTREIQTGNSLADMFLGLPFFSISFGGDLHGNAHKTDFAGYIQDNWSVTPNLTLIYGLRWEWYGRIIEAHNEQSNWEPGCNCFVIAGRDVERQLVKDDLNNFAPRFGFAYRPHGTEKLVIRGGGGIYYDNQQRHNFFQITNFPFGNTRLGGGPIDDPFGIAVRNVLPFAIPKDYRDTYAEHWNLGLQYEIMPDTVLDLAYVGNHVVKAQRLRNVNQSGSFPGFGPILMLEQAGSSNFHSLQMRAERRFARGLTFISSYTWGHAIDDRPGEGLASQYGNPSSPFQNNNDARAERADADFDVRHRYTLSFVYQFQETGFDGAAGYLLNGWGINGILTLQGGRPFTVYLPGSSTRPDVVAGISPIPSNQGPDNWINPAAFAPPEGQYGTLGRNTERGPALRGMDLSIVKNFEINEDRRIQFRTEIFNLTNTPSFGLPNQEFGGGNFGLISSTIRSARQIQLGLRYEF